MLDIFKTDPVNVIFLSFDKKGLGSILFSPSRCMTVKSALIPTFRLGQANPNASVGFQNDRLIFRQIKLSPFHHVLFVSMEKLTVSIKNLFMSA